MASNQNQAVIPTGLDAFFASQPIAQTPRGGAETGFAGESDGPPAQGIQPQEQNAFLGMGPLLEEDDGDVYRTIQGLVLRQDIIARNHLAQDQYWTCVKRGYPWATLEYVPDQSIYKFTMPYGTKGYSIQAIPNKAWDLINKATETLLVDFPAPDPSPLNDSEEAQQAADMAGKFLDQDASEDGTNDPAVFYQAVDKALTCASSYIHCWTDPTGDGSVPLQIKAHPLAQSPENPLIGPDGMPTTDYVLRYVTQDQQFTNDPSQAAPQWMPKLRADVLGNEHIRVFPETSTVATCEKVVLLWYCTLGEAKRRWPETVGQMLPADLSALCDWTPPRYLVLLPPFERARWKLTTSDEKQKSGSSDERLMFYYHVYQRSTPEYPKGAELVVTGSQGGMKLYQDTLSADVEVTDSDGSGPKQETRHLDIPVTQLTPRIDADDRDPSGTRYIELFGGSTQFSATLQMGYLEACDIILHSEKYSYSGSPVEGYQITEARASGDAIPVLQKGDEPFYPQQHPLPPDFLDVLSYGNDQQDSISSLSKPAQGSNNQQEVSGVARNIAVQQASIGLSRMQSAVNRAYERYCRIKIQQVMRRFTAPFQIRYVGEDGAYKQEQWTGTDFALVGDVRIQAGSGTGMAPQAKINYLSQSAQFGLIGPDEAKAAARPTFARDLGIPESPHEQYIERCVASWLQGPPQGWVEAWTPYAQAEAQFQQAQQMYQQQVMAYQSAQQNTALVQGGPPPPLLGPENQNAMAMEQYQMAVLALQANPLPPMPPQPPPPVQIPRPWTPFEPRPNDIEPEIAILWKIRLSKVMSTVKYSESIPEWRQPLDQKYQLAMQTVQQALAPPPQAAPAAPQSKPSHPSAR